MDLSTLKGTGVGGRIRKQDVLEAAAAAKQQQAPAGAPAAGAPSADQGAAASPVSPLRGTTEKMSRLRKVIASRMVESLQVSAQLTTVVEVDLTRIARLRQRSKSAFEAREGTKLSFLPFLAKATIEALKAHPKLNASIDMDKGEITYFDAEHLGVAVDTERGLLVPVVRDAGDLNIAGLARKIADLADRTRTNKITPDELGGGTFTITNTGSRGALFDTPIINQPQVAHPRHRRRRQATSRGRRPRPRRDDRGAVDVLPRAVLRPPHCRRCRRRPLPDNRQAAARRRRLRGRPRPVTQRLVR